MKFTIATVAAFAAIVAAVPYKNNLIAVRQAAPITDADILNYALTLEHLEDTFYREGLANFTVADFEAAGFDKTVYENIKTVSADETTHVAVLTAALIAAGVEPVKECKYAFGVTDPKVFLATAAILEGVGVSAYLGAAADILSKTYLTVAGSILTVEARHSSYIRNAIGEKPFAIPFDVPLSLDEVYTLAAPFFVSCPADNPVLPVKAFPTLTPAPTNPSVLTTGTTITLLTPGYLLEAADGSSPIYAAFITVTGPVFAKATPVDGGFSVTIPDTPAGTAPLGGQSYVVLTGCDKVVSDDTVAAGPAIIEIV